MKMSSPFNLSLSLALALTFMPGTSLAQDAPALSKTVTLKSHGGVEVKAPAWKASRSDDAVSVLERSRAESRGGFRTLVVAVEAGPTKVEVVDWDAVKDNILGAAKGAGSDLALDHEGDWSESEGFKGHRFKGTMRRGERDVAVEMVALIAPNVMVTLTCLGPTGQADLSLLAQAVAKTARRPGGEAANAD